MTQLLIVECYDEDGIARLKSAGATQASNLYKRMLTEYVEPDRIDIAEIFLPRPAKIDVHAYDGICWTGSNLFFSKANDLVNRHIDLCVEAFDAGVPQFGSCWAAQLAAVAAGGTVEPNPNGREFGLARKITLTDAGKNHPMFAGKPPVFDGFTSHNDIVTGLPEGATVLATNGFSPIQALEVRYGKGEFWAPQYHPEYNCAEIAGLAEGRASMLVEQGYFKHEADVAVFVSDFRALNADPSRKDIAWKYGIDQDVQNSAIKQQEVRNWLSHFDL